MSDAINKLEAYSKEYTFKDHDLMMRVLGPCAEHLAVIQKEIGVVTGQRGDSVFFRGEPVKVNAALRLIEQLGSCCRSGKRFKKSEIMSGIRVLASDPAVQLDSVFNDVVCVTASKRLITPRGMAQKKYVDSIRQNDLVFSIGPAGTGKTYLAVAMAVSDLVSQRYKRIVITRPAVEAGERLGFLPGDLAEKINPYLRPLYDALNDMLDFDRTQAMIADGRIEIAPLAFMRGRTLNDSFVILDEAQNTTCEQMKMFLTRLGYSSKAVVTGDVSQIDLPASTVSGLVDAQHVLRGIENIGFCRFSDVDVVRHPLVKEIIKAYASKDSSVNNKKLSDEDEKDETRKSD